MMRNTDRAYSVLASSYVEKASIQLQQTDRICAGFYSTVFSVPLDKGFGFDKLNKGVRDLTEGKFEIEASSLYCIEDGIYRCILASTTESKAYSDETVKEMGLHSVRANLFIDPDNEILWRVEGDGESRRLVQNTQSDYTALLEEKRTRSPILASDAYTHSYDEHDYAYFFNNQVMAMDFGYVVSRGSKDYVFSRRTNKLTPLVTATQIVIADQPDKMKNPAQEKNRMVLSGDFSMDNYLDYLRQMYGSDNPYYIAWEKTIKQAAVS